MDSDSQSTAFVVGLGNPGPQYQATRHNLGYRVVDALADRWGAPGGRMAFGGRLIDAVCRRRGRQRRVMLLQPYTYMNASGLAVRELVGFYKPDLADVLVVLDDLALPLGQLRIRPEGTAGGQKGLADVLEKLGTPSLARLRIGIDSPPGQMDPAAYVLSPFKSDELERVSAAIQQAVDAVEDWLLEGMVPTMEKYNRKLASPPES